MDILVRIVLSLAVLIGAYFVGSSNGTASATLKCAGQESARILTIQGERDELQDKLNASARKWAEDKQRSEGNAARTVNDLRSNGISLSVKLADATVASVEAHNRGLADGRAELHQETAEALIAITQDADATVHALQEQLLILTKGGDK